MTRSEVVHKTIAALAALWLAASLLAGHPALAQEYRLGPGDELEISVLDEPDLTKKVTVRPDGKITFPLVGEVEVTGLTVDQLRDTLAAALRRFLKRPQVTVIVSQNREAFVYLVGQVRNPGAYEMMPGWTAMEAIAKAGGLTSKAALKTASVIRRASGTPMPLDLGRLILQGDTSADVALEVGDVILVPELKNRVLVLGSVQSPGAYDLLEGAKVLDAIASAGGPAPKAVLTSVTIVRQTATGRTPVATVNVAAMLKTGDQSTNMVLQNTDIVYVPAKTVTFGDVMQWLSGISLVLALTGF